MDHNEATQQMAAERYLLGELTPELRDAFEEHAFDCPECAVDLRAGAAFIGAAKVELPKLAETSAAVPKPEIIHPTKKRFDWQAWLRPAFAVPVFAALLALVAYQNLDTIPALRKAASEPSVLPSTAFHAGTRGAAHASVEADRTKGAALSIELPQESGYASFAFDLYDPQGKELWTRTVPGSKAGSDDDGTVSLVIPGSGLTEGSYSLAIIGIDGQGSRTEIDRRILDVHFVD
ncbi:MAG: zf-HC2 domain-containing protein [Terracidiphilus sp.]